MKYEEWEATFKPIKNHFCDAAYGGTMFKTFGDEEKFVREADQNKVWTLIEVDGMIVIGSGFHFVNRIGHFITEVPFVEDMDIDVWTEEDEEDLRLNQ